MTIWLILLAVCVAGAVGGIVNALLTDNGFMLPKAAVTDGQSILRPGFLGNMFIGAVAAGISWGLYGPLATYTLMGSEKAMANNPPEGIWLSVSSFVGAVLIGISGARWLTNEVDKTLLRAATGKAASAKPADPGTVQRMLLATPAQALEIAAKLTPAE